MGFDKLHSAIQHHVVNSLGWRSLRPLQEAAIDPLLEGENAILLAPTAGGKTEAAVFPVLSRMLEENWRGLSVLYVCPIKALLNNLHTRLEYLTGLVGRRVELWHGDVGESFRKRIRRDPPDMLLTTPESIEAILASRKSIPREFYRDVRVAIVDEVHAFAGDDRGWHLLGVLSRLEEIAGREIQRVGLSATVGNPEPLLKWIAPVERKGRVLNPPARETAERTEVTLDYVGTLPNAAEVIASLHKGFKRLVFCDSRSRVEELSMYLRERGVNTFVSHSSLGVQERRDAERAFAEGHDCVIVSTSTLELGIDVGDLDYIVQIDAPTTVASFLQRIGRTGRRPGSSRNCLFLATGDEALVRAAALLRLWKRGFIEAVEPPARPLHILAQQLMGLTLQERGITKENWANPARVFLQQSGLTREDGDEILDFMLGRDYFTQDEGVIWFGAEGEQKFGRRHFMDLLVVFVADPLLTVMHGRLEIGQVHPLAIVTRKNEEALVLAGRSWKVMDIDWDRKRVHVAPVQGRGKVYWLGDPAPLSTYLCAEYCEVLACDQTDSEWSSRAACKIEELRRKYHFVRSGATTYLDDKGQHRWWTWAGLTANAQIAGWLEQRFGVTGKADNFSIAISPLLDPKELAKELASLTGGLAFQFTASQDLANKLKFNECLPPPALSREMEARFAVGDRVVATLRMPMRVVASSD